MTLFTCQRCLSAQNTSCLVCKLSSFLTADAGHLYLMWLLLRRQERPVSGGFIFITRWNSLGLVRRVMNSMVGIHEACCFHQIAMPIISGLHLSRPQRPRSFWSAP